MPVFQMEYILLDNNLIINKLKNYKIEDYIKI